MITLADAIDQLKNLKSKIARTEGFITKSTHFYEDTKPDYSYADELATRDTLNQQILELQVRIQETNATAQVVHNGKPVTISHLILVNAQLRSGLAFYNKLLSAGETESFYSRRTKDDVKKVPATGYDKAKIRKVIEDLELQKEKIESELRIANNRTPLIR